MSLHVIDFAGDLIGLDLRVVTGEPAPSKMPFLYDDCLERLAALVVSFTQRMRGEIAVDRIASRRVGTVDRRVDSDRGHRRRIRIANVEIDFAGMRVDAGKIGGGRR